MKVKDAMIFLAGCNPEAEIGLIDDDNLVYELKLYGWTLDDSCYTLGQSKLVCKQISLYTTGKEI